MKKFSFLLLATLMSSLAFAQEGINFQHDKSWNDILVMAKKADKLVFVDAYTTWCAPCKKMTKEIFPQPSVGKYYNANFINVKMDMEKGEGITLTEEYKVRAFPTLLFIDGDGALVHRIAGYMPAAEFISLGKDANDPSRTLSAMDAKYEAGEKSLAFLKTYTEAKFNAADGSHPAIANEYLNTQDDWSTPENMEFIFKFVNKPDSKVFNYIMENRKAFENHLGKSIVTNQIDNLVYELIHYSKPTLPTNEVKEIFQKYFPKRADILYANYKMDHYTELGDKDGFIKAAIERFDKYPVESQDELDMTAGAFAEIAEDKALLKKAMGWAKQSIKMKRTIDNMEIVAYLHYKLGHKGKSKRMANKSIKFGNKYGHDNYMALEILELLKEM